MLSPSRETQEILQKVTLFGSNFPQMSFLPYFKWQWHIPCVNYRAGVPAHSQVGMENCTFPALQRGNCEVLTHQVLENAEIFTYSEMPAWSRESAWAGCGPGHPAPGFVEFQPGLSLGQGLISFAKVPAKLSDLVQPADEMRFTSSQRNVPFCLFTKFGSNLCGLQRSIVTREPKRKELLSCQTESKEEVSVKGQTPPVLPHEL